jgi:hypothetical protein
VSMTPWSPRYCRLPPLMHGFSMQHQVIALHHNRRRTISPIGGLTVAVHVGLARLLVLPAPPTRCTHTGVSILTLVTLMLILGNMRDCGKGTGERQGRQTQGETDTYRQG